MYQVSVPKRLRRQCLFKESCSCHVFRETREKGFTAGIKALKYRMHNCRPNYILIKINGNISLITAQNEAINECEIDERILMGTQITQLN